MDSYIRKKFVKLLVFTYSIIIFPLTSLSAFAVDGEKYEHQSQKKFLESQESENNRSGNNKENETANLIARNIQTVSNVLSSSPSELTEQAKSYALGKINSTVNGEAQKWLSQFGTAKINFSMDRKGKLDNGSLDLLLPLYDNKSDWLFFSQLGYRNKDSRNTLNLGFGGRYFTPSWMYGLNSFYDFDVTGNNKRIGLGGEAWTDYAKFSANTYWRVSDWHDSPHEKGWEERPANGFDINGEFFLPVYPNIGGKLAYEQYFGDQVALFNRDTKQKDPSLARFGVNYTPIPLVTMGVDYKLGSGGHSETLFQTNFNYKFGVPFEAQLSSDSVASMRTLAGSRLDLVERNNQIILDYRKKGENEVLLNIQTHNVTGYSHQVWDPIHATVTPKDAKLEWQQNALFSKNNGVVTEGMNPIGLTLPKYDPDSETKNIYKLNFTAKDSKGNESKPSTITVKVDPFVLKSDVTKTSVQASEPGEAAYKLLATITHGDKENPALANVKVSNLQWSVDERHSKAVTWKQNDTTNDKGQLEATISGAKALNGVDVYLAMDGMSQIRVIQGLDFSKVAESGNKVTVETKDNSPLAPGGAGYTFIATVTDASGRPLKEKEVTVKWGIEENNGKLPPGVQWKDEKTSDKTDDKGQISAVLISDQTTPNMHIGVSIDGADPVYMTTPVAFEDPLISDIKWSITEEQHYEATKGQKYTVTVTIPDPSKFEQNYSVTYPFDKDKFPGAKVDVDPASGVFTADAKNQKITFTLTSTQATDPGNIVLNLTELPKNKGDKGTPAKSQSPKISFKSGKNKIKIDKFTFNSADNNVNDMGSLPRANGTDKVPLTITVQDEDGNPASYFSFDPAKIKWTTKLGNSELPKSYTSKFTYKFDSKTPMPAPTTDNQGTFTFNMSTSVSLWDTAGDGVEVEVQLPSGPSDQDSVSAPLKDSKNSNYDAKILFNPVQTPAQLYVYNRLLGANSEPNRVYGVNEHGPSNVFNTLEAYFLNEAGHQLSAGSGKLTYSSRDETTPSESADDLFITSNKKLIQFFHISTDDNPDTRKVMSPRKFTATIETPIKDIKGSEKTEYVYHWKPKRWFLLTGIESVPHTLTLDWPKSSNKERQCNPDVNLQDIKVGDVSDSGGSQPTLQGEYGMVVAEWGFFKVTANGKLPIPALKTSIIVDENKNNPPTYGAYDLNVAGGHIVDSVQDGKYAYSACLFTE